MLKVNISIIGLETELSTKKFFLRFLEENGTALIAQAKLHQKSVPFGSLKNLKLTIHRNL
jgi:hypothetical protein